MDAINLKTVQFINSQDVSEYVATSTITELTLGHTKIVVDHTKRGQWAPVPFETALQEATIWVFFNIGGQWYGTGGERLRPSQTEKDLGHPSDIGPGWLYAADRWGPMANYRPRVGEQVGFCVVAGDQRNRGKQSVPERTNVILVNFPDDSGSVSYFAGQDPTPPPVVEQPPVIPGELVVLLLKMQADLAALSLKLDAIGLKPIPEAPAYVGSFLGYKIRLTPEK